MLYEGRDENKGHTSPAAKCISTGAMSAPGKNRSSQLVSHGVQKGRQALRILHVHGVGVHLCGGRGPGGSREPPEPPPIYFSLARAELRHHRLHRAAWAHRGGGAIGAPPCIFAQRFPSMQGCMLYKRVRGGDCSVRGRVVTRGVVFMLCDLYPAGT